MPPLVLERRHTFSPKNPFFQHAGWQCWLAYDGTTAVGRISAQVDRMYQERYQEPVAFFGLLEAEESPDIFRALLHEAEEWVRSQGMNKIRGPFNLSINQECGLLVEGFDSPPMIMMGHALPYYEQGLTDNQYDKAKDLLAFRIGIDFSFPSGVVGFLKKAKGSMHIRSLRRDKFQEDLSIIKDIFEEAWSDNWGFLPFTEAEFSEIGQQLKLFVEDDFVQIAEIDGQPVAMLVAFPNIHEVIKDLNGRLFPLGWLKVLWRLKWSHPRTGRVALMGVRKRYQSSPMGAAMAYGLIEAVRVAGLRKGIEEVELSWILEDNKQMCHILESLGAEPYKTYRIFEKDLST